MLEEERRRGIFRKVAEEGENVGECLLQDGAVGPIDALPIGGFKHSLRDDSRGTRDTESDIARDIQAERLENVTHKPRPAVGQVLEPDDTNPAGDRGKNRRVAGIAWKSPQPVATG